MFIICTVISNIKQIHLSTNLFSHDYHTHHQSQERYESQSEKQIDIVSSSLDEITEAVASLVALIKMYPVVLNHGIAHDYGEKEKKQCHYKNGLFILRESHYYISHGAKIHGCSVIRCPIPTKKVSTWWGK